MARRPLQPKQLSPFFCELVDYLSDTAVLSHIFRPSVGGQLSVSGVMKT
jgi:hypothetical protein